MTNKKKENDIGRRATAFLDHIHKNGFGGQKIGQVIKEGTWHKEYAIFVLDFDFPIFLDHGCDYCKHEFDYNQFRSDLMQELRSYVGNNCTISYNNNIHEYEIIGNKNSKFYKDHFEELEKLAEEGGHVIFQP